MTTKSQKENQVYFYTYDEGDSVRIQQKRVLGYSIDEMLIIESLSNSQTNSRYGDGTHCPIHNWKWSMESAKIRNFKYEFERQLSNEQFRKK